ncbi:MAG: LPS-assembly lipoprotein LptE [Pseudidiomarina mangrovi]|nr:MAG: LPS-assembly lipoprotein LptE [Pseudidiomarina mangrovi]
MRIWIILLISLTLSSCGFQLRDTYQLPASLQTYYLDAPKFSEFAEVVTERFELAGATRLDTINQQSSPVVIQILDDGLDRRALSLSASGQVAEYELIYSVAYVLHKSDGTVLAPRSVEVYRDYQDDPNFALAKTREREVLVREMRDDAARALLRQIIATLAE